MIPTALHLHIKVCRLFDDGDTNGFFLSQSFSAGKMLPSVTLQQHLYCLAANVIGSFPYHQQYKQYP
jgi:hypothetical protein